MKAPYSSGSLAASTAAGAFGQVNITSGQIDVQSYALSGRAGSLAGPIIDDPALGGTTGTIVLVSSVGWPRASRWHPFTPGTEGVVNNHSRAQIYYSTVGNSKIIQAACATWTDMHSMDGGTYQGSGDAGFEVVFTVASSTPYSISGNFLPDDQSSSFIRIENSSFFYFGPVGPYASSGTLGPGTYRLQTGVNIYEVPPSALTFSEFGLITARLVLGSQTIDCPADVGQQGGIPGADGLLDNNDFVVFIDHFFNQNPLADMGRQGGLPGADGLFDNNDFVAFIDLFFLGC